jgi:hypothetical protein
VPRAPYPMCQRPLQACGLGGALPAPKRAPTPSWHPDLLQVSPEVRRVRSPGEAPRQTIAQVAGNPKISQKDKNVLAPPGIPDVLGASACSQVPPEAPRHPEEAKAQGPSPENGPPAVARIKGFFRTIKMQENLLKGPGSPFWTRPSRGMPQEKARLTRRNSQLETFKLSRHTSA